MVEESLIGKRRQLNVDTDDAHISIPTNNNNVIVLALLVDQCSPIIVWTITQSGCETHFAQSGALTRWSVNRVYPVLWTCMCEFLDKIHYTLVKYKLHKIDWEQRRQQRVVRLICWAAHHNVQASAAAKKRPSKRDDALLWRDSIVDICLYWLLLLGLLVSWLCFVVVCLVVGFWGAARFSHRKPPEIYRITSTNTTRLQPADAEMIFGALDGEQAVFEDRNSRAIDKINKWWCGYGDSEGLGVTETKRDWNET